MSDQTPVLPRWLVQHREVVAERDRLAARIGEIAAAINGHYNGNVTADDAIRAIASALGIPF